MSRLFIEGYLIHLFIFLGFATALSALPESIRRIMHWHDYPKLRRHRMFI